MKKLLLLAALAVGVTACGGPTSGTVIEKKHEDARYYEEWNSCKTQYPVTRTRNVSDGAGGYKLETYTDMECQGGYETRFDDEDWKIRIENCKVDEGENKKECKRNWLDIDSLAWKGLKIGDWYGKENE